MSNRNLKSWIRASRPFSLTASVIPVVLGGIVALMEGKFHFGYFTLCVIAIILLQASVNLLNDHDDFINNVDTKESYCSSGVVIEGLLTPKEVKRGGITLVALGCLIGLFLSYKRGIFVLILEVVGALCGYFYTGSPLKLKYRGLGAPLVFIIFGPLMVLGSYYVQTQEIALKAFFVSIPVGLLTTAILHANDIRDMKHDKEAGIKTLSILVGIKKAQSIYFGLIVLSYISVIVMSIYRFIPFLSLICLITLPTAIKNIGKLNISDELNIDIVTLDKETAKLQSQFGILFILSMLLPLILM